MTFSHLRSRYGIGMFLALLLLVVGTPVTLEHAHAASNHILHYTLRALGGGESGGSAAVNATSPMSGTGGITTIPLDPMASGYIPRRLNINNNSQIVGGTRGTHNEAIGAVWANGVVTPVEPLGNPTYYSVLMDSNDSGQAIGYGYHFVSGSADAFRSFLWDGTTLNDLGTYTPDGESTATGINNQGTIVGFADLFPSQNYYLAVPIVRRNGTWSQLDVLSGACSLINCAARAYAVNNNDVAVGNNYFSLCASADYCNASTVKAVLWDAQGHVSLLDKGPLYVDNGGPVFSSAFDINDNNQVVGEKSVYVNGNGTYHAVLWENGTEKFLGAPTEYSSIANSLNNMGQIVGGVTDDIHAVSEYAVLWQDGVATNLNTVLPDGSGWFLQEAYAINNKGEIVGKGNLGYFLLSPTDTDGDGLPDDWETNGVTVGDVFINLPMMGANPKHKDIFVHADWMTGFQPEQGALNIVMDAFKNAPVTNPDGRNGINLHVDLGENSIMNRETGELWHGLARAGELEDEDDSIHCDSRECLNPDWTKLDDDLKAEKFTPAQRQGVFHYACFCDMLDHVDAPHVSGISRGIPGVDFLVTLGKFDPPGGDILEQAGTFMHELGHNLGLHHGGDDEFNGKPNYLSVMNYDFQMIGLYTDASPGDPHGPVFDYSRSALPTMNEDALPESLGIQDPAGHISFFQRKPSQIDCLSDPGFYDRFPYPAIDWNCSQALDDDPPAITDVNADGQLSQELKGFDDWAHLRFDGGGQIGSTGTHFAAESATDMPMESEASLEDILRIVPPKLWKGRGTHPIALFAAAPLSGTVALKVNFDGTAAYDTDAGSIAAYHWDFGDGTKGTGTKIQHTYAKTGMYQASLNVTDNDGNKNLVTLPVTITVSDGSGGCDAKPGKPVLVSPSNKSTNQPSKVELQWNATACATSYKVLIKEGSRKGPTVASKTVKRLTYKTKSLKAGGTYVWQVQACDAHGCGKSKWWSFAIQP